MYRKLLFLILIAAIVPVSGALADGHSIKIGAIFDLTGPTSDVGTSYAEGVRAYVDWVNGNGGIGGMEVELFWEDYAYSVPNAEDLYTQFVEQGVVAFSGWGTGDSEALRGRIAEDQVPFVSASYSAALNDPNDSAPYNFLVGTTYSDQLVIMLQYMMDQWSEDGNDLAEMRVAFFHHDSPFGTSPLADGEAVAEMNGVATVRVAMPRGATDLSAELENADNQLGGMTHIIIQNVSSPAALLIRNATEIGMSEFVQIGCLNWCSDEILVELAGDAAEGVLGALPFGPHTVPVEGQTDPAAWLEANGSSLAETSLHFTQGWWTMAVILEGVRLVVESGDELTGANVKAALESLDGFSTGGVTSDTITFTPEDHRGNRSLIIFAVDMGEWQAVSDVINLREMPMSDES